MIFLAISFESKKPSIARIIETNQIVNVIVRNCNASAFTVIARLSIAVKIKSSAVEIVFVFSDNIANQIPDVISYSPSEEEKRIPALSVFISSKSSKLSSFLKIPSSSDISS